MSIVIISITVIVIIAGLMVWSAWTTKKLLKPYNKKLSKEADEALERIFIRQLQGK